MKEATSSKLGGETSSETDTFRKGTPIGIDRDTRVDTPVTMDQGGGGDPPIPPVPPIDPIDPLVRPRDLPIVVPQNLARWICHPTSLSFMGLKIKIHLGIWKGTSRGWLVLL